MKLKTKQMKDDFEKKKIIYKRQKEAVRVIEV